MNNELRLENAFLPKDTLLPDSLQDNGQHLDDYIVVTFQSHHGFPHNPPPNKHNNHQRSFTTVQSQSK